MAIGILAAPGTQFGPCAESCRHIDCAATKAQAASPCAVCHEPIGYEVPFYDTRSTARRDEHVATRQPQSNLDEWIEAVTLYWSESNFTHADCAER
jgi:hypothetical protein